MPVLVVIVNNGYLSLIRQQEKYNYNMGKEMRSPVSGNMC